MTHRACVIACLAIAVCCQICLSQEKKQTAEDKQKIKAGHSQHGEAFNEGPRQKAYLMGGTGKIHFPVKSENPLVQKFVEQGIGQLHGYWYFEAERSFRQAAKLDPNCAIAYWGMAKANKYNQKRAKSFISEAVKRKKFASKREQQYIEALNQYMTAKGSRSKKAKAYVSAIKAIAKEYPDDLEAEALLGYLYYTQRRSLKMSYEQVDKHLKMVLKREPMHPVHHYIIHLWDLKEAKKALKSSSLGGQSCPEIAHMWHMPGHIYSRLKRYGDAVWQQEASARIDHKHMIHDRVLPDQIHNFAHNNEWLIRNLIYIGRWKAALDLAKNMTELPRHPKYNTLPKRRSAYYGRTRLFQVLSTYELWDDVIELSKSTHLEPTTSETEQIKRLRHLGIALVRTGDKMGGAKVLDDLQKRLQKAKPKPKAPQKPGVTKRGVAKPKVNRASVRPVFVKQFVASSVGKIDGKGKSKKGAGRLASAKRLIYPKPKQNPIVRSLEQAVNAIQGHTALADGKFKEALALLRKAGENALTIARMQCQSGDKNGAVTATRNYVKSRQNQVQPQAGLVDVLWLAGNKKDAVAEFKKLRKMSGHIQFGSPVFDRLAPVAKELGCNDDWRIPAKPPTDVGKRPKLDDLGPFRWHPSPAPDWALRDSHGKVISLDQYRGKPVLVIFYLGSGCLHCAEQLQAFGPMTKKFEDAGIALLAISTDDDDGLKISEKNYKSGDFPFPLVSNNDLGVFKAYRAFDDFENVPLHGTFLIDEQGLVRWQDISYEPFMDAKFALAESKRLLGLARAKTKKVAAESASSNWTRFRGPNGSGISNCTSIPVKWTEKDHNWKTPIPGAGHSSPVVWGERLFVTSGVKSSGKRIVLCLNTTDGKIAWRKEFDSTRYKMHRRNSVATSTPVVDAERVYVCWATPGSLTVMALAHDGSTVWKKDLGNWRGKHGFGVSPILHGDLLILANDQDKTGSIVALERDTGKVLWNIPRKSGNATYATPCVYEHPNGNKEIIFTNWKHGMTGIDPKTGKLNWEVSIFEPGKKERSISSPVIAGDLVLGTCGFVTAQKHFVAVRPPAPGSGQQPKEIWRIERQVSYLPTPLVKDGLVFLCSELGVASCLKAATGKIIWQERIGEKFYASPVCAGNHIYCASTDGEVFVLTASEKFQVVSRNALGEPTQCTPAIAGGRIFFRTEGHVIALGSVE